MNRGMYKGILVTLVLFAIGLLCAVLVVSFVGGDEIAHALQEFSPVLLLPVRGFPFARDTCLNISVEVHLERVG